MEQQILNQFEQSSGSSGISANPLSGLSDTINTIMFYGTIISLILTVLIITLWIAGWLQRRKVNRAILDIQATLHEMNERDKQRLGTSVPSPTPSPDMTAESINHTH